MLGRIFAGRIAGAPLIDNSVFGMQQHTNFGAVSGGVRLVLRLEGLMVLLIATWWYASHGAGWGWFAAFFLAPDLSFLGYLAGARVGAVAYNAAHSYIGALLCLLLGAVVPMPLLSTAGLIWCAHIGFDRALGYGLKYGGGFGLTHLGRIGRGDARRRA